MNDRGTELRYDQLRIHMLINYNLNYDVKKDISIYRVF